ncbi:VOC family protein [Ruicaihuangia caeni]|uniref:VOC family protein n=1 Tax=Ruicaihuangia caeni TaxID=3042517 RepID=UPI00338FD008
MNEPSVGRLQAVVLDCPDPSALAQFYAGLLGLAVDSTDDEWVSITGNGARLSFQRVEGYRPPEWPGQVVPQQLHLDIEVDDMQRAHDRALELGARQTDPSVDPLSADFVVYLDPAGHPFCLFQE